ncbi:hypothetical protein K469DRAFT_684394 [Zopfia rhizophila CBS 207.26]|uniref:Uncharacterized protein n=1 Tax=Zopfia rhizophila CBS 207.26 TaxID=1314779 RepID=A0A6A6DA95_9PEZI|nr:hypothetical protein K469DRAFT_684394 [Zopfia rhizophila CBS 207.26]
MPSTTLSGWRQTLRGSGVEVVSEVYYEWDPTFLDWAEKSGWEMEDFVVLKFPPEKAYISTRGGDLFADFGRKDKIFVVGESKTTYLYAVKTEKKSCELHWGVLNKAKRPSDDWNPVQFYTNWGELSDLELRDSFENSAALALGGLTTERDGEACDGQRSRLS